MGYPRQGLVALWRGEGSAAASAGPHHGRASGGVTYAPGRVGQAFRMDGNADWIVVPNAPALRTTGGQTLALWLHPDKQEQTGIVISKGAFSGEGTILLMGKGYLSYRYGKSGPGRKPYFELRSRTVDGPKPKCEIYSRDTDRRPLKYTGRGLTIPAGRWTHVAVVRDFKAGKVRLYVNGGQAIECEAGMTRTAVTNVPLYLGGSVYNGRKLCFAGSIDEAGLWNRPLSAREVRALCGGAPAAPRLFRPVGTDVVLTVRGTVLPGEILNTHFTVASSIGTIKLPAARVAGIAPPVAGDKGVRVVLTDGQVIAGRLADAVLIRTRDGLTRTVSAGAVGEAGYRISAARPASIQATGPLMTLTNGSQLAWRNSALKLRLKTLGQTVPLAGAAVATIEPATNRPGLHRVRLANGSVLVGRLLPVDQALRPALKPEVAIATGSTRALTWPVKPVSTAELSAIDLTDGGYLFGRLVGKTLKLAHNGATSTYTVANLRGLERVGTGDGMLRVRLWDGAVATGTPKGGRLRFTIATGMTLTLRPDHIRRLTRTAVTPAADWVKRVEGLVRRLGADDWRQRDQAQKQLMQMPPVILPILKKHLPNPDLEVQTRLEKVIAALKPGTPPRERAPVPLGGLRIPVPKRR